MLPPAAAPESAASPASAIRDAPRAPPPVGRHGQDTARLLDEARDRQRRFERERRWEFPTTWGGPVDECDERVGRFCLWHGDGDDYEPPPEPPSVRAARGRLIAFLDSARSVLPGNDWLAGQHVRYLVEAGRVPEAAAEARRCRAARWWCRALLGFALHHRGDYRESERAFERALDAMGRERRCRWTDLEQLLEGDLEDRYESAGCEARREIQRGIWWLADPLYLVPGNERRSEHFVRWVRDRMDREAESPSGVRWGTDLRELLLRYGWPAGWERDVSVRSARVSVISHYPGEARRFLARPGFVEAPFRIEPGDWRLDPEDPRSEYAPAYAAAYGQVERQVARFRRPDSGLVVAAYRVRPPEDREEGRGRGRGWVRTGLYLSRGPGAGGRAATSRTQGRRGRFRLRAPPGRWLLSLEAHSPPDSLVARSRSGIEVRRLPEEGVAASDLLLGEVESDTLPARLEAAVEGARASLVFRPGRRVGLYWELYGIRPGKRVRYAVTLRKQGGGLFHDLGRVLGLGGGGGPSARIEWAGRPGDRAPYRPRSLVLRLPRDLGSGRYRLQVEVRTAGGEPLTAGRTIRVEGDPVGESEPAPR